MVTASIVIGVLLGLGALGTGIYKFSVWLSRVDSLVSKELTHNGGSSLKDSNRRIEDQLLQLKTQQETFQNVVLEILKNR